MAPHMSEAQKPPAAHLAELPPMPSAHAGPQRPPSRLNRALGATSGSASGNVRALLALTLAVGFLGLFGFLAVEYLAFGRAQAQTLVEQGWGAILAAFGLIVGLYFGARNAETGG